MYAHLPPAREIDADDCSMLALAYLLNSGMTIRGLRCNRGALVLQRDRRLSRVFLTGTTLRPRAVQTCGFTATQSNQAVAPGVGECRPAPGKRSRYELTVACAATADFGLGGKCFIHFKHAPCVLVGSVAMVFPTAAGWCCPCRPIAYTGQ